MAFGHISLCTKLIASYEGETHDPKLIALDDWSPVVEYVLDM